MTGGVYRNENEDGDDETPGFEPVGEDIPVMNGRPEDITDGVPADDISGSPK